MDTQQHGGWQNEKWRNDCAVNHKVIYQSNFTQKLLHFHIALDNCLSYKRSLCHLQSSKCTFLKNEYAKLGGNLEWDMICWRVCMSLMGLKCILTANDIRGHMHLCRWHYRSQNHSSVPCTGSKSSFDTLWGIGLFLNLFPFKFTSVGYFL